MKKIKILHMPIYMTGGVNQYVFSNLKFIDKSRYHFDFATLSRKPLAFENELKEQGCKVHYISCYAEDNEQQFTDELNAIFDEGYDAIHLHTSFWRGFLIEQVAMQRKIPIVIVHSHSTMIDIDNEKKRKEMLTTHEKLKVLFNSDLATHFCACSNLAADWLFGEQIPRDRIEILNNAVDTDKFSYKPDVRNEYRKELNLENCFVIGHIGRFTYQKNHDILIDIFRRVCKGISNVKLLLIGSGDLQSDIQKKVDEYNLSDKVLFLGERNDIPALLMAMDVFALPSRFEGLPITLIEAQTTGLKCLASCFVTEESRITPNLEILPYNIDFWIDKIIEIAKNSYARTDMSDEITKAGYSIKEQIKILEKIYKQANKF